MRKHFLCSVSPRITSTHLRAGAQAPAVARLAKAQLIIVDEISMMRAGELDAIVQDLRTIGFKGVLLAVGNDAQLGPVIPRASASAFLAHHVTTSVTYENCEHFTLSQNMRMTADLPFHKACTSLGYGRWAQATPLADDGSQTVSLPCTLFPAAPATDAELDDGRRWIHPTMFSEVPHVPFGPGSCQSTIISPTRDLEAGHNTFFVGLLPGDATVYRARDEISHVDNKSRTRDQPNPAYLLGDDMVDALDDSGAPRGTLKLKPGVHSGLPCVSTKPYIRVYCLSTLAVTLSGVLSPCRNSCPADADARSGRRSGEGG